MEGGYVDCQKIKRILVVPGQGSLTPVHVLRLGRDVSANNWKSIAMQYLGLDLETIENLQWENKDDQGAFKRSLIRRWEENYKKPDSAKVSLSKFSKEI